MDASLHRRRAALVAVGVCVVLAPLAAPVRAATGERRLAAGAGARRMSFAAPMRLPARRVRSRRRPPPPRVSFAASPQVSVAVLCRRTRHGAGLHCI